MSVRPVPRPADETRTRCAACLGGTHTLDDAKLDAYFARLPVGVHSHPCTVCGLPVRWLEDRVVGDFPLERRLRD